MAIHPKFSPDFSHLVYIANDKFLSHSGNYQLKYLNWETQ